jgi:hypothetical protein
MDCSNIQFHSFLTSALDYGQLHAPATLVLEKSPGNFGIKCSVGPKSGLDGIEKEKTFSHAGI